MKRRKTLLIIVLLSFFSCKRTDPCPDEDKVREVFITEDAKSVNPYEGDEIIHFLDLVNGDTIRLYGTGINSYWETVKTHSPNIQCQRTYKIETSLLQFTGVTDKKITLLFRYDPFSESPVVDRIWITSNICLVNTYASGTGTNLRMGGFKLDSLKVQGKNYLNVVGITNWHQDIFTDTVYVSKEYGILKIKSPRGHWELLPE